MEVLSNITWVLFYIAVIAALLLTIVLIAVTCIYAVKYFLREYRGADHD